MEVSLGGGVRGAGGASGSSSPTGPAGGDLGGNYPNPSVTRLQSQPVAFTAPTSGQVLFFNGSQWRPTTPAFGGDVSGAVGTSRVVGLQNCGHVLGHRGIVREIARRVEIQQLSPCHWKES